MTERELYFCQLVREKCLDKISELGDEESARKLGILPIGMEVLRIRDWSLQEAFRIADILEVLPEQIMEYS